MGGSQRGQNPSKRAVARHDGAEGAAFVTETSHGVNEPVWLLLGCQRTHKYEGRVRLPRPRRTVDETVRGLVRSV